MNLQPFADRVIVSIIDEEEVTPGGVIIPDNAREKSTRGIVKAVGPGSRNDSGDLIPVGVQEGDTIVFSKYGGTYIDVEREEYLVLREADILAVEDDS